MLNSENVVLDTSPLHLLLKFTRDHTSRLRLFTFNGHVGDDGAFIEAFAVGTMGCFRPHITLSSI